MGRETSSNGPRVLLVEDNRALAANIAEYLEETGCSVDHAQNGVAALKLASSGNFDVIVLDLALPLLDGIDVCSQLRERNGPRVPVLMLTARDTLDDKLRGFAAGADDYVTKPFALAELKVRIDELMRRRRDEGRVLRVDDLSFDTMTLTVIRDGRPLRLSPIGLRLLELLMRRSPAVVSRQDIEHHLWGDEPPEGTAALRVHVHALRRAIDEAPARPLLRTMPGIGYAIAPDAD